MKLPKRRLVLVIAAILVGTAVVAWFVVTREDEDVRRFRQIRVGMDLETVKTLFPDKKPRGPAVFEDETEQTWSWVLGTKETSIKSFHVVVDQAGRVTYARIAYVDPFDRWLSGVAESVGISHPLDARILEIP